MSCLSRSVLKQGLSCQKTLTVSATNIRDLRAERVLFLHSLHERIQAKHHKEL